MGKACKHSGCVYPIFSNGFCKFHQHERKDEKYLNSRKSISERHIEKMKAKNKENGVVIVVDEKDGWFNNRRNEMVGCCLFCLAPSEKKNDKTFKRSVAHLFPKRKNMFPSIALHPENSIELCFFYNSCHTNFDNGIITFEDIKNEYPVAWKEIIRKAKILYPLMTKSEQPKVPEIILQELNPEIL